jgi:hypothetical protein
MFEDGKKEDGGDTFLFVLVTLEFECRDFRGDTLKVLTDNLEGLWGTKWLSSAERIIAGRLGRGSGREWPML